MGWIHAPRGTLGPTKASGDQHTQRQKCTVTLTPWLTALWPQAHGDSVTSGDRTWGLP